MFQYGLPDGVSAADGVSAEDGDADGGQVYRLRVFKQPGTRPELLRVTVGLPAGATFVDASLPAQLDGGQVILDTTLATNLDVTVRYRLP